ncbi:hypothetical protein CEB3_c25760 [Peptococcaceae bacterium CEB3]|nr:hypothetical protein CEB3_c25760 [Peptococcaceae bacterium CEB3]
MASGSKGNCYICGAELGKTAMKNHILKAHGGEDNGQLRFRAVNAATAAGPRTAIQPDFGLHRHPLLLM